MDLIYTQFFEPVKFYGVKSEEDYKAIEPSIKTLDAFSRITPHPIYVIDYYKQNFLYISPNSLFLNSSTIEEIKNMGYMYYYKLLPLEDRRLLEFINKEGFSFYYKLPELERIKYSISYDFFIYTDSSKKKLLVNQKLTPIILNDKMQIWLALCVITIPPYKHRRGVIIKKEGSETQYTYNFTTHKWENINVTKLTNTNIDILRLSEQGLSNQEIADVLFYDINSIKFHKKQIFSQFKVKSIKEAVEYAYENKLI